MSEGIGPTLMQIGWHEVEGRDHGRLVDQGPTLRKPGVDAGEGMRPTLRTPSGYVRG